MKMKKYIQLNHIKLITIINNCYCKYVSLENKILDFI